MRAISRSGCLAGVALAATDRRAVVPRYWPRPGVYICRYRSQPVDHRILDARPGRCDRPCGRGRRRCRFNTAVAMEPDRRSSACVVLWCDGPAATLQWLSPFEIAATHRPVMWLPFWLGRTSFENDQPLYRTRADLLPAWIYGIDRERPAKGNMDRPGGRACRRGAARIPARVDCRTLWRRDQCRNLSWFLALAIGVWIAEAGGLEISSPPEKPAGVPFSRC